MKSTANHADSQENYAGLLLWPAVVFLVGLLLTGAAYLHVSIDDDEKSLMMFNLHAQDAARDVKNRVEVYFGVLHSAGGLFAASELVTSSEWNKFVSSLRLGENYPGMEGMGVIRCVSRDRKGQFEKPSGHKSTRQAFDAAGYSIRPPGMRDVYYPVAYFWPRLDYIDLMGLDHGAYPDGAQALRKARDSGQVTISAALPYASGGHKSPILFLLPIYRNGLPITTLGERRTAIWGFVYARMDVDKLFQDAVSPSVIQEIHLEVFDGVGVNQEITSVKRANLIYDADNSSVTHLLDASYKPRHYSMQEVRMDGVFWSFYTASRAGGTIEQRSGTSSLMLFFGGLLSLGAGIITLMRNRQRCLIQRYAYFDNLTGLPNRRLLHDRFQQALANAQRNKTGMALLFLDLDSFKQINDGLGHKAGDEILKTVAVRSSSCLREGDTISRLGGDEFIVLLLNICATDDAHRVAQKILDALSKPIIIMGQELQVGCSIGISMYPQDGADYETMIKNADAAMYRAKESGHNIFRFH